MDLNTLDSGAKMRFALLHLTNAIAKDTAAGMMSTMRKRECQLERNEELIRAIRLCQEALTTVKRPYRRRVRRDVRRPKPQKQPQRRPAP